MTAIENPKTYKWVGTRPIRHDGYDKVVGKARFAAVHPAPLAIVI